MSGRDIKSHNDDTSKSDNVVFLRLLSTILDKVIEDAQQ
jgi:hypothetical protein